MLRLSDFFMASLAVSDAGVAARQFAFRYYFLRVALAMAMGSGTISFVSRFNCHETSGFASAPDSWMQIATEILRKGMPVPGRRIVETGSRITFMFVIGVLGTPGVAASAIVRRFKTFALIPGTRRTGLSHRAARRGRRLRHLGRHRRLQVPQGDRSSRYCSGAAAG